MLPRGSTISGFVETTARAAAVQAPGSAVDLPERSKESVGIVWIKHYIDGAGFVVFEQNLLPGATAIYTAKYPTLFIVSVGVAERGNKDDIRVPGIDDHGTDVPRVFQTNIFPGVSAVQGFVNSIAVRDVAANASLAGPCINDVMV